MTKRFLAVSTLAGALVAGAARLEAQTSRPDTARPQPAAAQATPRPEVSGVLYLSFVSGGTAAERRAGDPNRFDLDRAYLTVRAPAGDRVSVRLTTDVYQQRDSSRDAYYRGWAIRAKYAHMQYDYLRGGADRVRASAKLGLIQTPIIEHEEGYWPRGIAPTALDQTGYFSSADAGVSTTVSFPDGLGEAYVGVLNGAGYSSRETDRFKDLGARITLVPLAGRDVHPLLRSLALSPWAYKGARASDYVRGRGTVAPVAAGVRKDRAGVHLGIRDARVTAGAQLAWRADDVESADTTRDATPTTTTRTGRLLSTYAVVRPLAWITGDAASPLQLLARYDRITPNVDAPAVTEQVLAGIGWSLNSRTSVWLDYQNQDPKHGSSATDLKAMLVQAIVSF